MQYTKEHYVAVLTDRSTYIRLILDVRWNACDREVYICMILYDIAIFN